MLFAKKNAFFTQKQLLPYRQQKSLFYMITYMGRKIVAYRLQLADPRFLAF